MGGRSKQTIGIGSMMDYTGTLLIASPHLQDPNFRMTVILLAQQSEKDVYGLILNRKSQQSVGDFFQSVFQCSIDSDEPLYLGGPLVGPVALLTAEPKILESESVTEVCLTMEKNNMEQLARHLSGTYRLFLGHAGWSIDQLAAEINNGVWHLLPADEEDIFSDPGDLWLRALQKSARSSMQYLNRLPHLPANPVNN